MVRESFCLIMDINVRLIWCFYDAFKCIWTGYSTVNFRDFKTRLRSTHLILNCKFHQFPTYYVLQQVAEEPHFIFLAELVEVITLFGFLAWLLPWSILHKFTTVKNSRLFLKLIISLFSILKPVLFSRWVTVILCTTFSPSCCLSLT